MTEVPIRLRTPAELVASIPALIGFHPVPGDGVLVVLEGRRLALTARFECAIGTIGAMAPQLADAVRSIGPDVVVQLVVYSPDSELLRAAGDALVHAGVPVAEAVRVHEGQLHFADGCSEPVVEDLLVRPAVIAASGGVVRSSRRELEELLDAPGDHHATEVRWLARDVLDVDSRDARLGRIALLRDEKLSAEVDLAVRAAAGRQPGALADALATYLAVVAYLAGDGALANVALERVTGDYSLARLMGATLARTVPPAELRTLLLLAAGG